MRGKKAEPNPPSTEPLLPPESPVMDMARLVSDWRPRELERMRQTVLDAACGLVLANSSRKRGQPGMGDEYLGEHETEWGTFHLYRRPPDTGMLKLLVEQNLGRPGNRAAERVDPVIRVYTAVAGYEEAKIPDASLPADSYGFDRDALGDLE